MRIRALSGAVAIAALAVQPCIAAEDLRSGAPGERRSSAFAGASLRLPLGGGANRPAPTARLQLSISHDHRDARGGLLSTHRPNGIELGIGRSGAPTYFIGGQEAERLRHRLGVKGSTTTWLIVGGVLVLAVVVLAAVADAQPTPGP